MRRAALSSSARKGRFSMWRFLSVSGSSPLGQTPAPTLEAHTGGCGYA
jgi:hypothetical protein